MKVIFMGTPFFAVPALKALIDAHDVVAVFTQAPKPSGRGMSVSKSPIHQLVDQLADQFQIPVYTPKTLRNTDIQEIIFGIQADVIVVAAYGFIIPSPILSAKKYGCINIHPSLLPKFRGAAPLQRTIMSGESKTGVCIIKMDDGIDTGDIMSMHEFDIDRYISLNDLHDMCASIGANMLLKVMSGLDTELNPVRQYKKQSNDKASYAHKLSKGDGYITWDMDAYAINCLVRGCSIWPGTFFMFRGIQVKILSVSRIEYGLIEKYEKHEHTIGEVLDRECAVMCGGGGYLVLESVQLPGRGPISGRDFMNCMHIKIGDMLES
jgi:methionyl-tRNA formyltransferase